MTGMSLFEPDVVAAILCAELGWLSTYAVHAAIAAAATEGLVRFSRPSPSDETRLWKMAFLLPLATACAALLFRVPLAGRTVPLAWVAAPSIRGAQAVAAAARAAASGGFWAVLAAASALPIAMVAGGARFAIAVARLRRQRGGRRASVDPRLRAALARVSARFALGPIALTESAALATPTAIGRRAICFPTGSAASLADDELDAVLAHELAHLERLDPAWFLLVGLVQDVFWMQPFNQRVAARLRRSAELACDERAVAATGDALGLARGLSVLAHAAFGARAWAGASSAIGGASSTSHALVDRVRRLATAGGSSPASARGFPAKAALLVLAVVASAAVKVTFAAPFEADARAGAALTGPAAPEVDVAAVSRRAASLGFEELRLQAEMGAAQAGAPPASIGTASRLVELEQDLRHVREERAWLERSASKPVSP